MSLAPTVETYLNQQGVRYRTEQHSPSRSSVETAERADVDEAHLAKSVVLVDDRGFVLAVLPASRRLDLGRVCDELGRSLRLCREQEIAGLFPDCEWGAIPPLGAAYGIETVVDASLEECDEVFFEGGDHETLVRMGGDEFLDVLANAAIAEIATEWVSLSAARVSRERLYDSLIAVEQARSAPIGTGSRWRRRMQLKLEQFSDALSQHILETEGPGGLLSEIEEEAPRLAHQASRLRAEHATLTSACQRVRRQLEQADSPEALRSEVLRLMGHFSEHRHRGADLVYEAFGVDIGGG